LWKNYKKCDNIVKVETDVTSQSMLGFTKTGAKLTKGKTNRLHRLKIDPLIKKNSKTKIGN